MRAPHDESPCPRPHEEALLMTQTAPVRRSAPRPLRLLAGLVIAILLAALPVPARAEGDDSLDQKLGEDRIVRGNRTLSTGHADIVPKFDDRGRWRLMIHDDAARQASGGSVWRHPGQSVITVPDGARRPAPEGEAYEFLGVSPGDPVHVLPQTQNTDLVWLGWNTQDPEVMKRIDRGVTLSLTGVQGPGRVATFLQSGSFGPPEVLWQSGRKSPQSSWIDVNTHTHANWVFTRPGVYLVEITVAADLTDGSHVSDTQQFRFSVGSGTSSKDALAARWSASNHWGSPSSAAPSASSGTSESSGAAGDGEQGAQRSGIPGWVVGMVAGAVIVAVIALLVLRAVGSRKDRRSAFDERSRREDHPGGHGDD